MNKITRDPEQTKARMLKNEAAIKPNHYNIDFGMNGEELAAAFLIKQGWTIAKRNWRAGRKGEVDIIARDSDNCLVFIEVKARRTCATSGNCSHSGFEAVHGLKQHTVVCVALKYLESQGLSTQDTACRFDVIIVQYDQTIGDRKPEEQVQLIHIRDAFHHMGWS